MKQTVLDFSQPIPNIEITEDSEVLGLYIGKGDDIFTGKFDISHRTPSLRSRIKIKAVLYDNAKFDVSPVVKIHTGAKFTDAYLKVDVLLIGKGAVARAVPSLEITENDVKGGHGATVGKLDKDQLFYLMTRGLSKPQAEAVLIEAFINDIRQTINQLAEKDTNQEK